MTRSVKKGGRQLYRSVSVSDKLCKEIEKEVRTELLHNPYPFKRRWSSLGEFCNTAIAEYLVKIQKESFAPTQESGKIGKIQ